MSFASHEANLRYFKYLFSSNAYNVNSLYKATKMNLHPNIETIGITDLTFKKYFTVVDKQRQLILAYLTPLSGPL